MIDDTTGGSAGHAGGDGDESSQGPVKITEIQRYQGRKTQAVYLIYKADSGWYFLKADIDAGKPLRAFQGIMELQQVLDEPLRLIARHQVVRSAGQNKPIALKKIYSSGTS